jgi:hypothetical protein
VIGPALGSKYKKPGQRYFALAVLREAVKEDGKVLGYKDKTVDVTIKGKDGEEDRVEKQKAVVVVNMAWKNFFSILNGYGSAYGTVLDRDYQIQRQGEKLETTYTIIPLNPITTKLDDADVPFDLRNDALMARYLPKAAEIGYARASDERLIEVIAERASDDFYARFFDTTKTVASSTTTQEGVTSGTTTVPTEVVTPESQAVDNRVNNLVSRIRGAGTEAYTPQADAPAEEPVPAGAAAGGRDFS